MTINLNDEDLFTAITGSGAYSWGEWYVAVSETGKLTHHVEVNCEGVTGVGTVTPTTIREAIVELRRKYPGTTAGLCDVDFDDPECDSDFDAVSADAVIQQIVLGDVIFG
jgi:hypothetical protein